MGISIRTSEKYPEITIVDLRGRLDVHNASEVEKVLNNLINSGKHKLLLNLAGVEYLSSSGLRVFIATKRKLDELKGSLKLTQLNDTTKKIFKIVELIDLFDIYETEEEALASFK